MDHDVLMIILDELKELRAEVKDLQSAVSELKTEVAVSKFKFKALVTIISSITAMIVSGTIHWLVR